MQPTVEMLQDNYTTRHYTALKIPNNMNYITIIVTHLKHTHIYSV